jgi:hypothetical protein
MSRLYFTVDSCNGTAYAKSNVSPQLLLSPAPINGLWQASNTIVTISPISYYDTSCTNDPSQPAVQVRQLEHRVI